MELQEIFYGNLFQGFKSVSVSHSKDARRHWWRSRSKVEVQSDPASCGMPADIEPTTQKFSKKAGGLEGPTDPSFISLRPSGLIFNK